MTNRDLLKEAIADAKTLKETAIANAKAALEEAFEPRLKSMLSAKLEEMDKEEMEEEVSEEVTEMKGEEMEEAKMDDMEEGYGKENMDEEMDLDEILAELDEEVTESEEISEEVVSEEEVTEVEDEDEAEASEEDETEAMDDEEIDLEEMTEDELKDFIEDVIKDMVEAGELEAGDEFEEADEEEMDMEMDMEDEDEEIEIEADEEEVAEIVSEEVINEEEELNEVGPEVALAAALGIPAAALATMGLQAAIDKAAAKGNKVAMALSKGMEKMGSIGKAGLAGDDGIKEELDELRAELHEVNLLNAKLLYTNKIFRAKNLKEAQKVKVLEAFDKAETVKEVKLVFETLTEEVNTTKTVVKENLGRASKPAGVAAKAPIVDIDPQVARWQKLAGIK